MFNTTTPACTKHHPIHQKHIQSLSDYHSGHNHGHDQDHNQGHNQAQSQERTLGYHPSHTLGNLHEMHGHQNYQPAQKLYGYVPCAGKPEERAFGKFRNCVAAGFLWGLGFMAVTPVAAQVPSPVSSNLIEKSAKLEDLSKLMSTSKLDASELASANTNISGSANASSGSTNAGDSVEASERASAEASVQTVEVFTYNAQRQESTVSVPLNPKRVAVIDYAVLDIMHELGVGEHVVGVPQATAPEYLHAYTKNAQLTNTGTIKEVDLEALIALEPEVIFIGGRLAAQYEQLSKIAPVVLLAVDYQKPLLDSVQRSTAVIAKIFSKQQLAQEKLEGFTQRIERIKAQATNRTAVVGLVNSSQFKTLGNQGRCSLIGRDLGFTNVASDINSTHGNESNFELLVKLNPEFIFVLDRDSAIGKKGAKLAQDVMRNELVAKTQAAQNQRIFFLNPSVWYMSEGGIKATDLMLQDIEAALD